MWRKAVVMILVMVSMGSAFIQTAVGAEFPTNPVEIVVAFGAGSTTDIITRVAAESAKKYLGQPFVIVGKGGAGGSLAAADVVSAKPDGYKILSTINTFFYTTVVTQKVPFEPSDLTPLVNIAELKDGFAVKGDSPWKTFKDVIDYAKKNPGKLKWGVAGLGTSMHTAGVIMFKKEGVQTVAIPYKGSPEKVAALLGGHVDMIQQPYGAVKDLAETGKIRYLVWFSDRRYAVHPEVPSAVELGYPQVKNLILWITFYVHKNTPPGVKNILVNAFKKASEDPEFKENFAKIGEELKFMGPEEVLAAQKKSIEIVVPILKDLGVYVGK